ncbi:MAG: polyketide synthase, partial [Myxococcales bacterium]
MSLSTENKYAVVGMGGIFPGAQNLDQFWRNLVAERVEIKHLPPDSLERAVFFRPEVLGRLDKADSSYTDLLATTDVVEFDGRAFRIPPTAAARMDRNQQLSLLAAEQALSSDGLKGVDRNRVCVFMGSSMIGQLHHDYVARLDCRKYEYLLQHHPDFCASLPPETQQRVITEVRGQMLGNSPNITEDSAPGVLPNIIAARISAAFDFHGHAYVIDAACASGLAALICGVQQLQLRQADAVVCGAVDVQNQEFGRTYFSGMGALSPEGSFPFDERASGFVVGDGAGALVLKRLEDAISADNRIFAVVTGFGQTSDGKGKTIAAPNEVWQARTIQKAWAMAGVPADSVEMIEAHATSTQVGDLSEVNALKRAFAELGATRVGFCGIGSVKSNIGHLKSAAGIAGFLKAALALERKYLPPTAGIRKVNPKLQLEHSPFYVLTSGREWRAKEHPRRAGVSAFGFGGANYHIALEEFRHEDYAACTRQHGKLVIRDAASEAALDPIISQSPPSGAVPVVDNTASKATVYALPLFEHGHDVERARARV